MPRTLYVKLAAVLAVLLASVGVLSAVIGITGTRDSLQQASQELNRNLARDLVMDRNLVAEGRLNQPAIERTFHQYMVINPSIEIYLLDPGGVILSHSADPG